MGTAGSPIPLQNRNPQARRSPGPESSRPRSSSSSSFSSEIRSILFWVVMAILLLLGLGILGYLSLARADDSARWVDHTHQVIARLDAALSGLKDIATSEGDFLQTGEPSVLQPLAPAVAELQKQIRQVRSLTSDNPAQQQRLSRLEALLSPQLTGLAGSTTTRPQAEQGLRLTRGISQIAQEMRMEEYRLLEQRIGRFEETSNRKKTMALLTLAVALLLLSYAGWSLYKETRLRLETRTALAETEEMHQLAVAASGIGSWSWDLVTDKLVCSDRCLQLLGIPAGTPMSQARFEQALHPEDRESRRAVIQDAIAKQSEYDRDYRSVWPDGSVHWLRSKGRPHVDDEGNTTRFQGIVIDMEERKQTEQALLRSERRYSALFANRTNAIVHCRMIYADNGEPVDYEFLQVNHAYELITGRKVSDLEGRTAREAFPGIENYAFDFIRTYGKVASEGSEASFEVFFEPFNQWLTVYAYRPEPGEFIAIFSDITPQKQAEEALRASEERFRQLAENIQEVFWVFDPASEKFLYISPAYRQVWGRAPEDVYADSREWRSAIADMDCERVTAAFATAGRTGVFDETYKVVRPDGSHRYVWDRGWVIRNEAGEGYRMVGVAEDITKRREAEEEIHRLNSELEQRVAERTAELQFANQELEAFSYSVSHDLRAPLRGIDGFARILVEEYGPKLESKPQRYLQLVRKEARRMGMLVDDLLSFSRLSRQGLTRQPVDMQKMVRQVWEELQSDREGRQVELILGPLPGCEAEPAMLKQVWVNLLANALKFTRSREQARIEVGSLPISESPDATTYYVRDNGVGFDMRYASKLFGVFQRMHRAEDYEGTGVGLAIVQRIVKRHGGDIRAEAAPNQGAAFFFTIEGCIRPLVGQDVAHD